MVAVALCIAVTTSSCGTMLFNNSNSGTNLTNVELSHANYRIVKDVEGFSSASYVFGIGGLSRKATRDNAIADMMRKADLTDSQAIVNVHIKNHFSSVLFFYMRHSCSVTAQVIEFLPEADTYTHHVQKSEEHYINNSHTEKTSHYQKRYNIGDLYNDGTITGYIFEVSSDGLHGKIVYPATLSREQWCTDKQIGNLPQTIDAEDGEKNMQIICNIPDWQSKYPAFATCAKLGPNWYLPANNELIAIFKLPIMNNKIVNAWTSTIHDGQSVETLNGHNKGTSKTTVVAVAKF